MCVWCIVGGADKQVKLWEVDTKLCVQEYRGHSDVVRDIKIASADIFLSAANDWWVGGCCDVMCFVVLCVSYFDCDD